jgi:hypothetical protein
MVSFENDQQQDLCSNLWFCFFFVSGIYGTKGTETTSTIPGSREGASSWTASDGSLWLFGGYGYDSPDFLGEC